MLYGGLRIGLYEPVKRLFMGGDIDKVAPLHIKIAAGMTTGALAIAVASPTDLVKVRSISSNNLIPYKQLKGCAVFWRPLCVSLTMSF